MKIVSLDNTNRQSFGIKGIRPGKTLTAKSEQAMHTLRRICKEGELVEVKGKLNELQPGIGDDFMVIVQEEPHGLVLRPDSFEKVEGTTDSVGHLLAQRQPSGEIEREESLWAGLKELLAKVNDTRKSLINY